MRSLFQLAVLGSGFFSTAQACLGYEGGLPTPTSSVSNSSPIRVAAGAVYDGGWKKFDRGSGACSSGEGGTSHYITPILYEAVVELTPQIGDADAVFILGRGATLKNVIIGKNQKEGVHCDGPCTLEFVCKSVNQPTTATYKQRC